MKAIRGPDRLQAMALIENLLVMRYDRRAIVAAVRAKFGPLNDAVVDKLLQEVAKRWAEESKEDRPLRIEAQRRALQRLYQKAESDKDWRVCIEVEKLLAKVDGTLAPQKVAVGTPSEFTEFDGRPTADLDFYAQHGYWPEHAPKPKGATSGNGAAPTKTNGANGHQA